MIQKMPSLFLCDDDVDLDDEHNSYGYGNLFGDANVMCCVTTTKTIMNLKTRCLMWHERHHRTARTTSSYGFVVAFVTSAGRRRRRLRRRRRRAHTVLWGRPTTTTTTGTTKTTTRSGGKEHGMSNDCQLRVKLTHMPKLHM